VHGVPSQTSDCLHTLTQEENSVLSLAATERLLFSGGQGAHGSDIHVRTIAVKPYPDVVIAVSVLLEKSQLSSPVCSYRYLCIPRLRFLGLGSRTLSAQGQSQGPSRQHPLPDLARRRKVAFQLVRRWYCACLGHNYLQMPLSYPLQPGRRRCLLCRLFGCLEYHVHWLPEH